MTWSLTWSLWTAGLPPPEAGSTAVAVDVVVDVVVDVTWSLWTAGLPPPEAGFTAGAVDVVVDVVVMCSRPTTSRARVLFNRR